MNAKPIVLESLLPVMFHERPVITTDILAMVYGTEPIRIQQNHNRNKDRFIDGKHFFKVAGKELSALRLSLSESQISSKTRALTLWTQRGAARHAKMLDTEKAWDVFERLEDCYFDKHEKQATISGTLADLAGTATLAALIDKLQKFVHEGEFIPRRRDYSLPVTRKHDKTIIKDFLDKSDACALLALIEWLRADGHDMTAADREIEVIRGYANQLRGIVSDIRTHAQYIEHVTGTLQQ